LAPPTDHLSLKFVPADTNNGDEYITVTNAAIVGIAPDYLGDINLNRGAYQSSLQVVGAADRSFEFEEIAGGHQQRRWGCGSILHSYHQRHGWYRA
jgi:hypothetical protein